MKPILSIIVPVYNAEKYLECCVDSILAQTFKDFELILVDDGSTDSSGRICDSYAIQDVRVRVFHQRNVGVSAARNKGLEIAAGKYIAMVDADDYINEKMFSRMISMAESRQTDLVICEITEVTLRDNVELKFDLPTDHVLFQDEIVERIIKSDFNNQNLVNSPCNKLYKRSIIRENNLFFPARERGEDWFFNINYIQLVESVSYIDEPLYCYCRHDNSAMAKCLPNQYDLWLENREIRKKLINKYNLDIDFKSYNRIWIEKVIFYLLLGDNLSCQKMSRILRDKEFVNACRCSSSLKKTHLKMMRYLVANRLWLVLLPALCFVKRMRRYA